MSLLNSLCFRLLSRPGLFYERFQLGLVDLAQQAFENVSLICGALQILGMKSLFEFFRRVEQVCDVGIAWVLGMTS